MSSGIGAIRMKSYTTQMGVIAAVLAVAALVAIGVMSQGETPTNDSGRLIARPGSPLPGGERVSLTDASARFATPIYRPESTLASDVTIKEVWMRTASEPEVYITYESGITLIVRPESAGQSTADFAKAQINDGVPGTVVSLGSVDAFGVPPVKGQGPGSVRVVIPGAIFSLIGDGSYTLDDLLKVAESVVDRSSEAEAE
jgi:hypothetical protein